MRSKAKLLITFALITQIPAIFAASDATVIIHVTPYTSEIAMTQSVQAGITPDDVSNILKASNERSRIESLRLWTLFMTRHAEK